MHFHQDNIAFPSRKALRLKDYDYSTAGSYFITICTEGHKCLFGHIENDCIVMSQTGEMVDSCLTSLETHHKGVRVLERVVMPNHIHFIIFLDGCKYERTAHNVENLIQQFKSYTTHLYAYMRSGNGILWQRNYYEHIIRNERSFNYIQGYIRQNPARWLQDKMNVESQAEKDNIMKNILTMA